VRDRSVEKVDAGLKDSQADALREAMLATDGGTVRNADQLIVLEKGEVVDIGSHLDLTSKKGAYYSLVKNQLELGE